LVNWAVAGALLSACSH